MNVGSLSAVLRLDTSLFDRDLRQQFDKADREAGSAGVRAGGQFADGMSRESGGKLSGLLSKLGPALFSGGALVGAAGAAALWGGFSQAIDQEASQGKFAAQLGGDPEYAAEMGRLAGRMYRDGWGDSLEGVQEAMRGVLQGGLLPEDAADADIERVTGKVLSLAEAFDQDLGMATAAVGQMIRTGLAPDADAALDIITRGMQQGADKSGDLLETLNEYGTQFRSMGVEGAAATGLLAQGLKAGARDADVVANALKEVQLRVQAGDSASAIKELGLNFEDVQRRFAAGGPAAAGALDQVMDRLREFPNPARQAELAALISGSGAEDMQAAFLALDPSSAVAGLGDLAGAADGVSENLTTNQDKIEAFKRKALGGLSDFVGSKVVPGLEALAAKAGPLLGSLKTAWDQGGLEGLGERAGELWDGAGEAISEAWPGIKAKLGELISNMWTWIQTQGPVIIEQLGSWAQGDCRAARGQWLVRRRLPSGGS